MKNEDEHRRRVRLREKFSELKQVINCNKKDRFNILEAAIDAIKQATFKIRELETEKVQLHEQLEQAKKETPVEGNCFLLLIFL